MDRPVWEKFEPVTDSLRMPKERIHAADNLVLREMMYFSFEEAYRNGFSTERLFPSKMEKVRWLRWFRPQASW
jgi:hypothetical protein